MGAWPEPRLGRKRLFVQMLSFVFFPIKFGPRHSQTVNTTHARCLQSLIRKPEPGNISNHVLVRTFTGLTSSQSRFHPFSYSPFFFLFTQARRAQLHGCRVCEEKRKTSQTTPKKPPKQSRPTPELKICSCKITHIHVKLQQPRYHLQNAQ